jgi:hypothetical protein
MAKKKTIFICYIFVSNYHLVLVFWFYRTSKVKSHSFYTQRLHTYNRSITYQSSKSHLEGKTLRQTLIEVCNLRRNIDCKNIRTAWYRQSSIVKIWNKRGKIIPFIRVYRKHNIEFSRLCYQSHSKIKVYFKSSYFMGWSTISSVWCLQFGSF